MKTPPTNMDDVIDSRDVIERIADLEDTRQLLADESELTANAWDTSEECEELKALKALADQCEGYAADWKYGETLIRDSYFKDYAQELAEDMGAVNKDTLWPNTCIDWDQAARELQQDYTEVYFDGIAYWIR